MQAGEDLRIWLVSAVVFTYLPHFFQLWVCVDEKFNLEVVPSNSLTGECSRVSLLATLFSNYEYVCVDEKFNSEVVPSKSWLASAVVFPCLPQVILVGSHRLTRTSLSQWSMHANTHIHKQTRLYFFSTPSLTMQEMNLWPLVMLMKAAKQPNRFEVPSLVSESTTGWEKMARV